MNAGPDGIEGTADDGTASLFGNTTLFTGRELDAETGLFYYRARYFSPELGRFLARDPISYRGGANLYEHVGNNPMLFVDPRGLLLIAVDGTSSRQYLDGDSSHYAALLTNTGRWRSHVRNFYDDYRGTGAYWHGPDSVVTGGDSPAIQKSVMTYLSQKWCKDTSQPIDMVGHSRGGYIVMEVARELKDKGICCNGSLHKPVTVRFMGLYDPVDMAPGYGEAETVPSNVKKAAVVYAAGRPGGNYNGDPWHARSRWNWNRADWGPEDDTVQNYEARWIFGTHSGLGGAPWDGDHPTGHSARNDRFAAIDADIFVRDRAINAGVPISQHDWKTNEFDT